MFCKCRKKTTICSVSAEKPIVCFVRGGKPDKTFYEDRKYKQKHFVRTGKPNQIF
jgi:hypothetical protein